MDTTAIEETRSRIRNESLQALFLMVEKQIIANDCMRERTLPAALFLIRTKEGLKLRKKQQ